MRVLTVSQINLFLKSLIEGDGRLTGIYVAGEISNFTDQYRSGHLYFSLKDERAVMKAVMFASAAKRLRFRPKNGMRVLVRCRVSMYEPSGQVQMYVEEMQPDGLGAVSLSLEQLKEKLEKEGIFRAENKKPIPRFPQRIGLITSPTGAAVRDVKSVLARRWPCAQLIFSPVLVQGEGAPGQMTAALARFNALSAADVIILGRGGGASEDLSAFNDEALVRAVAASEIPVISAVGHETDFTLCDFAADLRAPTPSAAAELAAPDREALLGALSDTTHRMREAMTRRIEERRILLDTLAGKSVLRDPTGLTSMRRRALDGMVQRLENAEKRRLNATREQLADTAGRLDAMSPLKVLARGYSILTDEAGTAVRSAADVPDGAVLNAQLSKGTLRVSVLEKRED